jgi:hypothetical protein
VLLSQRNFPTFGKAFSPTLSTASFGAATIFGDGSRKTRRAYHQASRNHGLAIGPEPARTVRFAEWDSLSNGPTLFELYGKALAKSARRFQKREPPPIDDTDLYGLKQETVQELRRLLRSLRSAFSRRRVSPSLDEIIDYFQKTVLAKGDACIHLKTSMNSWLQFFRADSISVKLLVHGKRTSPAALFDSWFAWCKGLEPETIRQKISELGRFVRDSYQS